jgi:hypothetical protein
VVFGTTVLSLYGLCKDVSISETCHITQESGRQKRKFFKFWKRSEREKPIDGIKCFDPLQQQPTREYVCRWMWETIQEKWKSMFIANKEKESQTRPTMFAAKTTTISKASDPQRQRSKSEFPTAFTPEVIQLSTQEQHLIIELGKSTRSVLPDLEERSKHVPWGGLRRDSDRKKTFWWAPALTPTKWTTPLEQLDGGNLLFSYLRIMNWPEDLSVTHFPFKLCEKQGCPAYFALNHTLTFREIYQPWLVTPSMKTVNSNGLVYHQGFSPSLDGDQAPHAIVWLRPALVNSVDDNFYARTVIRELERAVTLSMEKSNGRVGKFNVVVSGRGVSFGVIPSLKGIKTFVTILQDHYVDRLGIVLLTGMCKICEILLKLVLPLVTEEVRNKIVVVVQNDNERHDIFNTVLGADNIPEWLGGSNSYIFDVQDYYAADDVILGTDLEAKEYFTLLPYHS